ncbi:MAG: TetR/AcrR family transcriptional regulator [Planctomycetaceae bacterium]|nr:TetR/AcrR family transcriptional regulator [Planctomycetaceae bacterium]
MRERRQRVDVEQRRAELIAAVRELAADGDEVSVARFCRETGFSNTHIYRYFENWADLREQAGLPPRLDRSRVHARHTEESLIAELLEVAQIEGDDVSLKDFMYHTGISPHPVYRLFGRWHLFKEAAGLHEQRKPGLPSQHDEESLREQLRELVAERGSSITLHEFCRSTGISADTVYRYGGWHNLRLQLGLSGKGRRRKVVDPNDPKADIINNLFDLSVLLLNEPQDGPTTSGWLP